jgi:hypothetical protein
LPREGEWMKNDKGNYGLLISNIHPRKKRETQNKKPEKKKKKNTCKRANSF